jgi:diguanylate cyclase (GGDEF)-like protein
VDLGHVDALIISYGSVCVFLGDNHKEEFLERFHDIPYVLVEELDETNLGSSVIVDNYSGMYELVEHLVRDHGYREFTYLAGPPGNSDAAERKKAVFDVMKKYHIPFSEDHVAYGDYSKNVEPQVESLFARYPQMEAMICANDMMADVAYRVCEKRGLAVGRDIAVTGYDDWEVAESMNPPLTTVLQNSYDMGYRAAVSAYELAGGRPPHVSVVPGQVKYRASCGCWMISQEQNGSSGILPDTFTDYLVEKIMLSNSNGNMRREIRACAETLLQDDFADRSQKRQILMHVEDLLSHERKKYVSANVLMHVLNEYVNSLVEQEHEPEKIQNLLRLKDDIQNTILSHVIKCGNDQYALYQEETWFLPLISRQMMNHIEDEKEFFRMAMVKMSVLHARSSYIYLFGEPIRYQKGERWECPKRMYLAASQEHGRVQTYAEADRPVLTREKGISDYLVGSRSFQMSIFCLFAGEKQYGIFVTEVDTSELPLAYLTSMQIANALKFYELSQVQRRTRQKLEHLVQEINEKNEVLNFISENDALTGCLNRRGFMEQAVALNREYAGRSACMIYADLDHLKEINDCFGHIEGDFAIRHCASALIEAVGTRGLVGRIGGDEFVVFLLREGEDDAGQIISRTNEINQAFNDTSTKDYYIEISMGCQQFVCGEDISIAEVLNQADRALYAAKKRRRRTVCKKAVELPFAL